MVKRDVSGRDRASRQRPGLGLPMIAVVGLALLAVPRVVLHDLHVIEEGTFVNGLFVFVPMVVWTGVALWRRVPNPFLTLVVVGAVYGVFLAVGHQVLWNVGLGEDPPSLGGNLAGLAPGAQAVILRGVGVISSLVTGVLVGAACGLVAGLLAKVGATRSRAS